MPLERNRPRELPPSAVAELMQGRKIEAIKIVREHWGIGLKDAKDAVEAYAKTQMELAAKLAETAAETRSGCIKWMVLLVLAGIVIAFLIRLIRSG